MVLVSLVEDFIVISEHVTFVPLYLGRSLLALDTDFSLVVLCIGIR